MFTHNTGSLRAKNVRAWSMLDVPPTLSHLDEYIHVLASGQERQRERHTLNP
jgi:hypothetical protein